MEPYLLETSQPRVLLVLPDVNEARRIALFLQERGLEAVQVADNPAGYNILDTEQVDALVCEVRSPKIDGLRLLSVARMRNPDMAVVLTAGPEEVGLATRAMEEGAYDFQTRPLNLEKILAVIRRGLGVQKLVGEMHELARRIDRKFGFRNLIGNSAPIVRVYNRILQVCGTDSHMLVIGEPGTGRELVAAAIHHNSARRTAPLVRVDCEGHDAAFLERDLFGDGDGKAKPRMGRVEIAEGGTLVLDGIDDLPASIQARVLRLMRGGEFERAGSTKPRRCDLRLIAVASLALQDRVAEGRFRIELYDLLRGVTIEIPALRHRKRDIPLLIDHFIGEAKEETGRSIEGIRPEAMDLLVRYSWPGNVRELKSVVRGLALASAGPRMIGPADLPEEIRVPRDPRDGEIRLQVGIQLAEAERRLIEATLARWDGDRRKTARVLGIGLRTLQRRLAQYRKRGPTHPA